MYFPLYRGKQYELIALRDLAVRIATEGGVMPIIEPVRDNATTRLSFDHFLASNLRFILIVNPRVGRRNGILTPEIVHNNLIQAGLADYDNYLPALYVGPATTVLEVEGFLQRYEEAPEITFIFDGEVTNPALLELLHNVRKRHPEHLYPRES